MADLPQSLERHPRKTGVQREIEPRRERNITARKNHETTHPSEEGGEDVGRSNFSQ